jgi:diacylglycerol kinase (ATP)
MSATELTDTPRALEGSGGQLLILANRKAGALARMRGAWTLEDYAQEAGFDAEVIYTESSAHLCRILRERVVGKLDRVVIAGGDGTIHAATQVLARTEVALGILPQGTANNFATALRLPRDLPSALRAIAFGHTVTVDLGEVDGHYFTEGAGIGVFADTLSLASAGRDKSVIRTCWSLLQLLITNRQYRLTLVVDGVAYKEEVLNVTIANTFCVGLNLPIAPYARLTDSKLDVVLIRALDRREWISYFKALRAQMHLGLPKVESLQGREIEIRSRHPITVHIDDRISFRTPVRFRVADKALKVFMDRP